MILEQGFTNNLLSDPIIELNFLLESDSDWEGEITSNPIVWLLDHKTVWGEADYLEQSDFKTTNKSESG